MPSQTRVHKETSRRGEMDELADEDVKATSQKASEEALLAETERILDEIDEALGDEIHFAEAFWSGFVQKGGE